MAVEIEIEGKEGKARAGRMKFQHRGNEVETPVFMPVGTQGSVKGMSSEEMKELGCGILLGNTYHLGHRPGGERMREM